METQEIHRYKELADALELSINQFEKEIGVKQSRISKAVQRNAEISEDIVLRITTRYPDVNRGWLLTGDGSMFLSKGHKANNLANNIHRDQQGAKKPLTQALKEFILKDWLTMDSNAEEIKQAAEAVKRLEEEAKKNNDKNQ